MCVSENRGGIKVKQFINHLIKNIGCIVLLLLYACLVSYVFDISVVSAFFIASICYLLSQVIGIVEALKDIDKELKIRKRELEQLRFEMNNEVIKNNLREIRKNNEKIDEMNLMIPFSKEEIELSKRIK
jgi:hypothetical protein